MLPQTHSWLGEGRRGIPLPGEGDPSPFLTPSRLGVFWHRGPLIPPKVWQPLTPLRARRQRSRGKEEASWKVVRGFELGQIKYWLQTTGVRSISYRLIHFLVNSAGMRPSIYFTWANIFTEISRRTIIGFQNRKSALVH